MAHILRYNLGMSVQDKIKRIERKFYARLLVIWVIFPALVWVFLGGVYVIFALLFAPFVSVFVVERFSSEAQDTWHIYHHKKQQGD